MDVLSSNSMHMLEKSMEFLWTKQAAVLDNIANAETPNYKTKVVTFEDGLRAQLERAAKSHSPRQSVREVLAKSRFDVEEPGHIKRMDDNGVDVTEQSVELVRNSYQLQYVMNSISSDFAALRIAIRGQ